MRWIGRIMFTTITFAAPVKPFDSICVMQVLPFIVHAKRMLQLFSGNAKATSGAKLSFRLANSATTVVLKETASFLMPIRHAPRCGDQACMENEPAINPPRDRITPRSTTVHARLYVYAINCGRCTTWCLLAFLEPTEQKNLKMFFYKIMRIESIQDY